MSKKHKHGCLLEPYWNISCTCKELPKDSAKDALMAINNGCGDSINEGLWTRAWKLSRFKEAPLSLEIEHKDSGKRYRLTIEEIK